MFTIIAMNCVQEQLKKSAIFLLQKRWPIKSSNTLLVSATQKQLKMPSFTRENIKKCKKKRIIQKTSKIDKKSFSLTKTINTDTNQIKISTKPIEKSNKMSKPGSHCM